MKRFLAISLSILLIPALTRAQAPPPALAKADLDAYAAKVLADWHAPGVAIAVVKDDKVIFARGFGIREIGKPEPIDEHTVFDIASCSKAFTVAALAILEDEGKLVGTTRSPNICPAFNFTIRT